MDKVNEKLESEEEESSNHPQGTDIETWHRPGMDLGWPHVQNFCEVPRDCSQLAASVDTLSQLGRQTCSTNDWQNANKSLIYQTLMFGSLFGGLRTRLWLRRSKHVCHNRGHFNTAFWWEATGKASRSL